MDDRDERDHSVCTFNAQNECIWCGAVRGEPCPACGGDTYHAAECPEIG